MEHVIDERGRTVGPAFLVGVAVLLSTLGAVPAHSAELAAGERLPPLLLSGLNGPDRTFANYRGRPLLINVWASWCGPCRAEAASLERLAWMDGGRHFAVIGISTDDDAGQAQNWLKRSNATINHYLDHHLVLEHLLGASRLPLTVLVAADGRILDRAHGAREWDSAESRRFLARAFKNPAILGAR
jgi:thiol-disulfide isomerase/thioredoxin